MSRDSAILPTGRALDYRNACFLQSAAKLEQCPADDGHEVAFMGRSNAGKSSAINALTSQRGLARTSKTPGRTQLINFFSLAERTYLVDLPGFGYAKVSEKTKQQWQYQLERYLQARQALRGVILLMDIRHPFKELDRMMIDWALAADMPLHILLTKADKLKRGAAGNALLSTRKQVAELPGQVSVQLFSAQSGQGIRELADTLDHWLLAGEKESGREEAQADG